MSKSGLANRLYRGEAGLNLIGKRKVWFGVAGALILVALLSFGINRFSLGIEFAGGNQFIIPASQSVDLNKAQDAVNSALADKDAGATALPATQVGRGGDTFYEIRTSVLDPDAITGVKADIAQQLGIAPNDINDSAVSAAWGKQVTERAVLGLLIFVALVMVYLILRFEWRMAVAAVSSLLLNLVLTAGLYSLAGFEVTPATIIGFLTILGFALYDVVVVFDKVQENTRGITASSTTTYGESANLAINQTLMRSINTGLVALLPVGGLLIAGLSGASTLADLGLVLFVGMAVAVYSSIFFATPVLVTLKDFEPKIQAHTKRVLARRAALARGEVAPKKGEAVPAGAATLQPRQAAPEGSEVGALAGSTPKVGARPNAAKRSGGGSRGGRPGGNRPGGAKRR
ncbi:protein-export membrane protein SecF [Asanoa ishikariensis]|uniref:Protein-export membrane protein SecF n=1 Tax=Asanoa ishikariensis TaxID=137265 RepID=A0A1H3SBI8_9ACTN|nr:protein translocase subunit SecF [Asanoa ishikariensis]GIF70224.1 protein-export membrane protein SecF [Asanoa ishikariensis]SDZ35080.1 protein translocase subunit secF [Asanoa ishikariensis]